MKCYYSDRRTVTSAVAKRLGLSLLLFTLTIWMAVWLILSEDLQMKKKIGGMVSSEERYPSLQWDLDQ